MDRHYRIITYIIIGVAIVFLLQLFKIQVLDSSYKKRADDNALREITDHPARGLVYDRNDSLLVYNDAAYDLMVVPCEVRAFDTTDLCLILDISKEELMKRIEKARAYSKLKPSLVAQQMSKANYGYLQEKMYKFPGFFVQNRTLRHYPKPIAAHILGYVGEVEQKVLEEDEYYQLGDYIGISGIEKAYEQELRGTKGKRKVLVDVHNREMGSYKDGAEDEISIPGLSLWSTIDLQLQEYGEKLMENKRGSIVAIEPATGEILCIVSTPSYDPNLLVGSARSKNYAALNRDSILKPLFNRALMAMYPPGSTFKLANGLIALQEEVITPSTQYPCGGGYNMGSHIVKCHVHANYPDLIGAIATSCNAYFCRAYYNVLSNRKKYKTIQESYQAWKNYINALGFGVRFDSDLPYELKGIIPSVEFFDKRYRKSWNGNSVVSMGIGQGEAAVTPIQMANFVAIIANRGFYYKPHVIKAIGTKDSLNERYSEKIDCGFDKRHFDALIAGMENAVLNGTARVAQIPGIKVLGKTGTAQNPHGKDHSVFVCIAPKDEPKIVVFCLVENGGFGAAVAAPIASLITEFYLNRTVKRKDLEQRIISISIK
ncbi:MAG: penicillin-binding protein 2 [Bacteroidetes bacterium]|nr:penicillin-binding protein 2 [Bacteroidota bacterium]MCL1968015.1 penicillin-binding protein 2 [Bacteroidota bacterium]